MDYVDRHSYVGNIKLPLAYALHDNLLEDFYLGSVELLTHFLNQPYITKELGSQVSIANYGILDKTKMSIDKLNKLIFGLEILGGHKTQTVAHARHLAFYDSIEHLFLTLKIGVKRASSLFRSHGNIVHCRIIDPTFGKKVSGHVYELISSLRCSHNVCKDTI